METANSPKPFFIIYLDFFSSQKKKKKKKVKRFKFLTLAPIWLPHWPAWMCTISLIVQIKISLLASSCVRGKKICNFLLCCSSQARRMGVPERLEQRGPNAEEARF